MAAPKVRHFLNSLFLKRDEVADFDAFPFCVPAVRQLAELKLHPKVTFLVGENGSGKSTILEALADKMGFAMSGGGRTRNPLSDGYQTELAPRLGLSRTQNRAMDGFFLRAESYYNHATMLDELEKQPFCGGALLSYGGKSLHDQSHGEAFFSTLVHRLGGDGVYLLDEPEAALSPQRQLSMLVRIHDLVAEHSQFVIATHSPIIMAYPDAWIYSLGPEGIERINYEDTEHFQVTRNFLRDPKGMLRKLLAKPDELNLEER